MSQFNESSSPESLAAWFEQTTDLNLDDEWWLWPSAIRAHQLLSRRFLEALAPYPEGRFAGRGIVICAGGQRLFPNGWVCMRVLRLLGCTLPIEFWHFENEIDAY